MSVPDSLLRAFWGAHILSARNILSRATRGTPNVMPRALLSAPSAGVLIIDPRAALDARGASVSIVISRAVVLNLVGGALKVEDASHILWRAIVIARTFRLHAATDAHDVLCRTTERVHHLWRTFVP